MIFDNALNGLLLVDVDSKHFVGANPAFLKMFGYTLQELAQLEFSGLHPKTEMPRIIEAFRKHARGETTASENVTVKHRDGQFFFVDINGSPFVENGNQIVLGEFHDINLHKQAEDALREQESFFRLIAENIDGFIAVLDTEGRKLYNSPSYIRLLGNRNMSRTDSFLEIHPDDRERVRQSFIQTVASGIGQHLEYRFITPEGNIRQMESRGGVIIDSEGCSKRVVVVSNDVTEHHAAAEKSIIWPSTIRLLSSPTALR